MILKVATSIHRCFSDEPRPVFVILSQQPERDPVISCIMSIQTFRGGRSRPCMFGRAVARAIDKMDGVLKQFDLERKDLDFRCPRNIRDRIAGELVANSGWYLVGRALNVSDKSLDAILSDNVNRPTPELKAVAALDAWDEEHGEREATCLKLADALHAHNKRSTLEILCEEVRQSRKITGESATASRPSNSSTATGPGSLQPQENACQQERKILAAFSYAIVTV